MIQQAVQLIADAASMVLNDFGPQLPGLKFNSSVVHNIQVFKRNRQQMLLLYPPEGMDIRLQIMTVQR
ncbi:hypothetical protein D3C73_1554100 [compost metagenome]